MSRNFSTQKLLCCLSLVVALGVSADIVGPHACAFNGLHRLMESDSLPQRNLAIDPVDFRKENTLYPGERINDKVRNNLFVLAKSTKLKCFVGEPLIVTYKLYSRLNAKSFIAQHPSLAGFSKRELVRVADLNGSIERIGGQSFEVRVLRKFELIPIIAGTLEIDPMEVEHSIHFKVPDSAVAGPQLTDFLHKKIKEEQGVSKSAKISTRSSPILISVRDLPEENRPASYIGAVGSFTIKASLSPTQKRTGENAVLRLDIKGSGSLVLTGVPSITLPKEIELLQVKALPGCDKTDAHSNISRSFEYLIVFRKAGVVQIPPVSFSYFDPVTRNYKTTHSMSISTSVLENPAMPSTPREVMRSKSAPEAPSKNFVHLFLIAIAASILLIWNKAIVKRFRKRGSKRAGNMAANQSLDIHVARAVERLTGVKSIDQNESTTFYYELNKVLWSVITEKISLLPTQLSKGNIFRELSRQGWTPEEVWDLELTMNEYERNLYVPGYKDENDFEAAYQKAVNIISKLEELTSASVLSIQNSN